MSAMFKFSYGLFVLTAREDDKDNGCIINTAIQVTSEPKQVSVCVNKSNYTCEMIQRTGKFGLSFLSQEVDFDTFRHFGFQSGRDTDKFSDYANAKRAESGLLYLTKGVNAFIAVEVNQTVDLGTHMMFIGSVVEEEVLSDVPSVTYQYYFDHIKPKPEQPKTKGYVCKICGYVYTGETLPKDFVCPLCKHGAEDFEPIG
ncbi:flavin reductase [Ihubacter sp. rT4E-8]|uniref:flavin reductase n=1 Tax=Ihubacter sp. rT4E-8 TaxID=3242369 RepID=UPI003CF2DE5B